MRSRPNSNSRSRSWPRGGGGGLVQARVGLRRHPWEDDLGHLDQLLRRAERQARLLDREPVEVAVQEPVRVGGVLDRVAPLRAGSPAPPRGGADSSARALSAAPSARSPRVARECLAHRGRPLAHGRVPAGIAGGQVDLAEHDVDHPVQRSSLFATWLYRDIASTPSRWPSLHAERLEAGFVGEGDGSPHHALPVQGSMSSWFGGVATGPPLDKAYDVCVTYAVCLRRKYTGVALRNASHRGGTHHPHRTEGATT